MGWGNAVGKGLEIIDSLFGLSPEAKKIKLRNQIFKLERRRSEIIKEPATNVRSNELSNIDNKLTELRKIFSNI
jgi:hypothetical protein